MPPINCRCSSWQWMLRKIVLPRAGNGWWPRVTGARIRCWAECIHYGAAVCAWRCQPGSLGWRQQRGQCLSCCVSWWLVIGHRSTVALSSPMCQITADVPVSDIIIGLTLITVAVICNWMKNSQLQLQLLWLSVINYSWITITTVIDPCLLCTK